MNIETVKQGYGQKKNPPLVPSRRALATRRGVFRRPSLLISSPKPCNRTFTASLMAIVSGSSSNPSSMQPSFTPFSSSTSKCPSSKAPIDRPQIPQITPTQIPNLPKNQKPAMNQGKKNSNRRHPDEEQEQN
jgi:hypothetical protein